MTVGRKPVLRICTQCQREKTRNVHFGRTKGPERYALVCLECKRENRHDKQTAEPKRDRALQHQLDSYRSGSGGLLLDAHWRGHTSWGEVAATGQRWSLGLWQLRREEQVVDGLGPTATETC